MGIRSVGLILVLLSALGLMTGTPAHAMGSAQAIALDACRPIDAPGTYRLAASLSSKGDCFTIRVDNVSLDCADHALTGVDYIGKGIRIQAADPQAHPTNIELQHCHISHFLYGIEVQNAQSIRIHDNDLSGNFDDTYGSYHGIWLGLVDGGGVRVNRSADVTLEANSANKGANGLDVRDSTRVTMRGNTTNRNSANGVVLTNTSDSLIENNIVSDNVRWCTFPSERGDVVVPGCDSAGIMLQDGSSRNRVRGNQVLGQNGDGIFVRNHTGRCGDDTVIENNQITGAVWNGIEAGFCDRLLIRNNTFAQSKFGAWISYMDGVTLLDNTFTNMEQAGLALKNTRGAVVKHNAFHAGKDGVVLVGSTEDEKFGWTLRHPFAYYRSTANVITENTFAAVAGEPIHQENSTANVVSANQFTGLAQSAAAGSP